MQLTAVSVVLLCSVLGFDGKPPDLARIERQLGKEPKYIAQQPLYGLAVIGPAAKTRVWLVLDKSAADNKHYDVLYADLNSDGDLTQTNERFTGKSDSYGGVQFILGNFTDPATGDEHQDFKVSISDRNGPAHSLSLKWCGDHRLGGGYPEDPEDGYMRFAPSVEKAPIVWFNGDGPFRFQHWISGKFVIGGQGDFKVFLGQLGVGKNSFCAFVEHVLTLGEPVRATLRYEDTAGVPHEVPFDLTDRC